MREEILKMKSIKLVYFALLREKANKESEEINTEAKTYGELYLELSHRYNFELPNHMVQVAVDDFFTSMSSEIQDHQKIVFIPPVAGG